MPAAAWTGPVSPVLTLKLQLRGLHAVMAAKSLTRISTASVTTSVCFILESEYQMSNNTALKTGQRDISIRHFV